jgi:hypothetical protein
LSLLGSDDDVALAGLGAREECIPEKKQSMLYIDIQMSAYSATLDLTKIEIYPEFIRKQKMHIKLAL